MVNILVQRAVVWSPRLKLSPSSAPSICTSTSVFIGLGPIFLPDQAPFTIWFEPVVPFTVVRELDHEWFVVRIFHYLHASSCL